MYYLAAELLYLPKSWLSLSLALLSSSVKVHMLATAPNDGVDKFQMISDRRNQSGRDWLPKRVN